MGPKSISGTTKIKATRGFFHKLKQKNIQNRRTTFYRISRLKHFYSVGNLYLWLKNCTPYLDFKFIVEIY